MNMTFNTKYVEHIIFFLKLKIVIKQITLQRHFHYHREMCRGVVCGRRDPLDYKEWFPENRDTAKPGRRFLQQEGRKCFISWRTQHFLLYRYMALEFVEEKNSKLKDSNNYN